jgi:hypothetical protein
LRTRSSVAAGLPFRVTSDSKIDSSAVLRAGAGDGCGALPRDPQAGSSTIATNAGSATRMSRGGAGKRRRIRELAMAARLRRPRGGERQCA